MDIMQIPTRWINKQNVVNLHNRLFGKRKEPTPACAPARGECWTHDVRRKKPVVKDDMLYDSINMEFLEQVKLCRHKVDQWPPRAPGRWHWPLSRVGFFRGRVIKTDCGDSGTTPLIYQKPPMHDSSVDSN